MIKNNTKERTAIEALSANVLDTRFENFDQVTIETAKNRIIDVVGCAIGGANAAGNAALIDLVKNWGGKEEATIWVHGSKAPAHNVALVNSIMARSFDFGPLTDTFERKKVGSHQSETTVPTALTMGEAKGINGKELITALLVGDDVGNRISFAFDLDFSLGWDGIGTLNAFAATAIAGRLLGLNKLQMRNAFGIVLNQMAGAIQSVWDGATTFKLPQGTAAQNGIFAAELAKRGWTGVADALLSRFGYYSLYTHGCTHPEMLTEDLGKIYYVEDSFKRYPSCGGTQQTIDTALALVSKHDINANDIEEVTIYMPRRSLDSFLTNPFRIRDYPHADAIFSLRYTSATALLRKSVKQEHFTEKSIRDSQVNALIGKTRFAELPETTLKGVEVKVKMKDGREFSESADTPGSMSRDEMMAKYMSQVDFSQTVTRENAEKLLGQLEKLEDADSLSKIVELLVV